MKDFTKTLLWFSTLAGVPPYRLFLAGLAIFTALALLAWALVATL